MHEDTGARPADVARAYSVARSVFDARAFWSQVEALDNQVSAELQTRALQVMWELLRQTSRWLLNLQGRDLEIKAAIDRLTPGVVTLAESLEKDMSPEEQAALELEMSPYLEGGFPPELARRVGMLPRLFPTLDVVETAARHQLDVNRVARVYFGLGETLGLQWLRSRVESLEVLGQWHARARANLRDEFLTQQNRLVERVLQSAGESDDPVGQWMDQHRDGAVQVLEMMNDMQNNAVMDYATVAVAVRSLAGLARERS
jgi:glutamate dehydrogenase